jgi:1,4-alpha-glucan branching enzyme
MVKLRVLLVLATCLGALAACSLTPIPDLTSEWVDPCDASVRLCEVPFSLKATTERSVEVRGDFRDGGWVAGEPMVRSDAGVWEARLELTWGVAVQYKFYVDGARWLTDPANPRVVGDGKGNNNSLLDPVTCAAWTCAPAR